MLIVKFYFQNLEILEVMGSDACYVYVTQSRSHRLLVATSVMTRAKTS